MVPAVLVGDHILVNRFVYAPHLDTPLHRLLPYRDPQLGDVVTFAQPDRPRRDLIKRVASPSPATPLPSTSKTFTRNGDPVRRTVGEVHRSTDLARRPVDTAEPPGARPPRAPGRSRMITFSASATTAMNRRTHGSSDRCRDRPSEDARSSSTGPSTPRTGQHRGFEPALLRLAEFLQQDPLGPSVHARAASLQTRSSPILRLDSHSSFFDFSRRMPAPGRA